MIIVFGSMNVDMVMPVDHFPDPGETVLCAADYLSRTGGKGSNQAVAAARMGAKTAMVGKIGDDAFGRRSIHNLKQQSVWTSGIGKSERPTGCATIAVDRNGANIVMTAPGANLDATSDQLPDDILTAKNILLTQLETAPEETFCVLKRACDRGTTTIFNASPAEIPVPLEVLKTVHYLIVNEIESLQVAKNLGIEETDAATRSVKIAEKTKQACIITCEEKGCLAAKDGDLYQQKALIVDVVDTTGAGDAFCGIFAACLQKNMTWLQALHYASVGASLSCLGLSAQAGMPFMEDIKNMLDHVEGPRKID